MTLANDGEGDGRLVAVETGVADVAEIHEATMNDGSMSMQQVDGIDVPAGGSTALEPGGLHVMLLNVDQDLAVGDTVALTLTFDGGDEQMVDAEVVPLSPDAG
jgi:copper(I)-binding protein